MKHPWLLLLLFACSPAAAPPATVAIPAATATSATANATTSPTAKPSAPSLDPATCGKTPDPAYMHCKWSVAFQVHCSGMPPPPPVPGAHEAPPAETCVCNGCESDRDCTRSPNGKCESFQQVCAPAEKACVYPGDLCAGGGQACEQSARPGAGLNDQKECGHDGHGHAVCGPRQFPPP